jgi:hypothetical protein
MSECVVEYPQQADRMMNIPIIFWYSCSHNQFDENLGHLWSLLNDQLIML